MVGQVDGVVAPEVLLRLHPLDHFVHCSEEVVTECPYADGALVRAERQVPSIARELHRRDIKDRVDLCSHTSSAYLVHEDRRPAQVFLVQAHICKLFSLISEVACVPRGERWHLHHDIKTRWVYQATLGV